MAVVNQSKAPTKRHELFLMAAPEIFGKEAVKTLFLIYIEKEDFFLSMLSCLN